MTVDGATVLSQVSGVPRDDIMSIWEQVKANSTKLRACPRHRFLGGEIRLGQKVVCLFCGGEMGLVSVGDYIRGYVAAGGDENDVWPGFSAARSR